LTFKLKFDSEISLLWKSYDLLIIRYRAYFGGHPVQKNQRRIDKVHGENN